MTLINLACPIGQELERMGFQPHWRTVFKYQCEAGHQVKVLASAFSGRKPVPGVGAIECPKCKRTP